MRATTGGIAWGCPVGLTTSGRGPDSVLMVDFHLPPDRMRSQRYETGGPSLPSG